MRFHGGNFAVISPSFSLEAWKKQEPDWVCQFTKVREVASEHLETNAAS
jgi:hypothetical protein